MQDHPIGIPACFSSGERPTDDPTTITRSGQSVIQSVYRVKVADQRRLITITWCKNLMLHGLSISVTGHEGENQYTCKVELKPWYFWRKQGLKRFTLEGDSTSVDVHWDLKNAKFNGETEPVSDYFVAVIHNQEVVLLLGDLKKDAYRKTGCRPALVDPILVSRKEHVFGKKKFVTRVKLHEQGMFHEISIECKYRNNRNNRRLNDMNDRSEPEAELGIRVDGHLVIHVKHLQWKFRGNESLHVQKSRVDLYWDVHDWLFNQGLRHALFIFKPYHWSSAPISSSSPPFSSSAISPLSSQTRSSSSPEELDPNGQSEFSFFLYAWKVE